MLIIGAQRSGTTSLFNYLAQHPHVREPLGKEIHYFDLHYARGIRWYRGRFPFSPRLRPPVITMDASPYYLAHPLAAERAARLLPQVKLIAMLRNPIERAFSHYQHEVRDGRETLTFEQALDREAERLAGEEERLQREPGYYSYNHHRYSYTRRGLYLEQLQRWTEAFPPLPALRAPERGAVPRSRGHERAGVPVPRPHAASPRSLQALLSRRLRAGHFRVALRARLVAYFEPHNRELYRWLGQEFDWA